MIIFTDARTRGIVRQMPDWAEEFPPGTEMSSGVKGVVWGIVTGYAENPEYPGVNESGERVLRTETGRFVCVAVRGEHESGGLEILYPVSQLTQRAVNVLVARAANIEPKR